MNTVDQLLRQLARRSGSVPYWVLEKDYALSYLLAGIAATPDLHDSLILKGGTAPVSYTHLRAHETVLDLVCRLLLEKKQNIQSNTLSSAQHKNQKGTIPIGIDL